MICRELVAVEDFGPGVAVTSHDGRTASLDGFAEAAAGEDEPVQTDGCKEGAEENPSVWVALPG